jgi:hypothetical protein
MYGALLIVHSWLRWAVIALAAVAVWRAARGMSAKAPWASEDERISKLFMIAVDIQLLLGLVLYGALSPTTLAAFSDFGAAMKDRVARFWAVEHIAAMLLAVVAVHVGRVRGKKHGEDPARHRTMLITVVLFLVLVAVAFPWPGTEQVRPLLRLSL